MPLLYTVKQAAAELQISETGLYRLISAGQVQTVDVAVTGRAKTRITPAALQKFIESRTSDRSARLAS